MLFRSSCKIGMAWKTLSFLGGNVLLDRELTEPNDSMLLWSCCCVRIERSAHGIIYLISQLLSNMPGECLGTEMWVPISAVKSIKVSSHFEVQFTPFDCPNKSKDKSRNHFYKVIEYLLQGFSTTCRD